MSKRIVIEISKDNPYYKFIEKEREKKELSFTAYSKYLLFEKIDDIQKEELMLKAKISTEASCKVEKVEEKKEKKDMLKNLSRLKK